MQPTLDSQKNFIRYEMTLRAAALIVVLAASAVIGGCGAGGYAGLALQSLSASSVNIDAGQSFSVTANDPGNLPLTWTVTGSSCTGNACGTVSGTTGLTTTYTGPAPLTAPIMVTLQAAISGTQSTKTVAITVNPAPTISGATPNGTVGTAYSATLTTAGGTGTRTLSLASGSLPAGLTFNAATGAITGTPTQPGTSNLVFRVVDSSDVPYTATATRQITIGTASVALTAGGNPPAGVVNTPYQSALQASGGTAPYTWTVTSGTLPAGLTLSSGGILSGTPTMAGTSTFTAQVQDAAGSRATATFTVPVTAAQTPVRITLSSPAPAVANMPYTGTIPVTGGTGTYNCTISSGSLPAGLALGSNCQITGTPTTPGSTTVTVVATDSSNPTNSGSGPVTVTVNPSAVTITAGTLPNGTVGTPYSSAIGVTGGTAPYTCSVVSGSLPAGLAFGANCIVSGTPTVAGTSTPTVRATDSSNPANSTTRPVSITISAAAATVTIASPPAATVNTPYTGTIPVSGGTAPYSCSIAGGSLPAGLTLGANCQITGTPISAGSTTVTVTATDSSNPANSNTAPVTVTVNPAAVTLSFGTPPTATVNTPYTGLVPVSGGTGPYACVQAGGTLPTGLSLNGNCQITGTPTAAGTTTVSVRATDSGNPATTSTGNVPVTVNPAAAALTFGTLPSGTVNTVYTGTIPVAGGTAPYTCQQTGGTLSAGLTLNANCQVTGTPTTPGTTTVTVKATDSANPANTTTGNVPVTINPAGATLSIGMPPNATINTPYTGTVPVSGGTAPYTCQQVSGTLPAGLTLNSNCQVTGTPTVAGTSTVTVQATDSTNPANTATANVPVTVNPAAVTLTFGTPASGTVNTPYTGNIPVAGGTAPYTCQQVGGTLPTGLTLNSNCSVTGTPTVAGTATVTVKATDASNPANTNTGNVPVTINPVGATLNVGAPPNATINTPYTGTIPVSGGTAPYICQQTGGTLPAGLALNSNCSVTGTPTAAGTTTVNLNVTDAANPANTTTANVPVTVNPAAVTLSFGTPAAGTVNVPYNGTVPVSGGTAPYTCQQVGGTLPTGLTLNTNCAITGTPTASGTSTVVVKATDSANPANTNTGNVPVTINPASATLNVGTPPNATVNKPYTGTIPVSGGTAPYTCLQTGGTLPAGLALNNNCQVTGTPIVAGTATVVVKVTDAASPANTTTASVPVTVNPAGAMLTFGNPPAATVNSPYTGTVPVAGGTAPYTCTLAGGTLPAGLTLGTNCQVTGTPTTTSSSTVSVSATDNANPAVTGTGNVTLTVNPVPVTLTIGNPPTATVSTPYTGTIPVAGGTAPYTCTVASGTLPAGLTLGAGCVVTGTPTAAGSTTLGITATDSANPANTKTSPVTITVQPVPALTFTGSLPNGVVNQAYSQTLQAQGGVGPYTYALTAGALPPGLTLSNSGVISGTPTAVGASSFTVTATDSEGTPQRASLPLVLLITYATTPSDAVLKGPYAFLFQGYDDVLAGVLAYQTATIGSFTADGTGVVSAGELDTNHQGSNPAGNTVASQPFLGSYTLGADLRGSLTITRLNANGTTGGTTTYALALRAPTSPATTASRGALIEYDGNQLAGTKDTGTLLQQTPAAFATGLSGSYAFGVSGDTPCLPACTVGLTAGPVASVGQFNANGGSITGGTADTNVAATNFPTSTLTGSYAATDGNGRVQLALNTSRLAGTFYPTDYAVYIVDANNAFVMSTDKHSAFILQAGTARLQTQATFNNASLAAPFVGYENSPVNPGLVGQTLQNVLNISTATVFRGTGNGDGTCNTTNVDVGGTAGLLNTLTGLGGLVPVPVVSGLLGTYAATGNSSCQVAGNGRVIYNYPQQTGLLGLPIGTPPPPRAVYLVSPNAGYFLETGYAGLGMLEAQTGQPFTLGTLNGTFVYSTVPASTLATVNSSGTFTADGQGHATSTLDENVGVGTINVLQLGMTGAANYSLTDATAGRYLLGTSRVIYAIAPGRFVLLETDAVSTTPYIALLF